HIESFRLRTNVPSVDDEPAPGGDPVTVTNPLSSQHSLLRQSLIGSLLAVVAGNARHGREDVAVFEVGKGYARDGARAREWWLLDDWDVRSERVVVAELAIAGLSVDQLAPVRASAPPSFPPIERDLAFIVSDDRAVADVAQVIRSSGGNLLRELRLFDIYRG